MVVRSIKSRCSKSTLKFIISIEKHGDTILGKMLEIYLATSQLSHNIIDNR
jgi:hypothetical protein